MKNLVLVCFMALVLSLTACGNDKSTKDEEQNVDIVLETDEDAKIEEEILTEEKLSFELIAGEIGEYGSFVTFNEGTDTEETIIAYHVPAGTYTVMNKGEYMNQISVYSDETHITEEGWEEPLETVSVKLVDVGESETITIEDGQYIELTEPAVFSFEMQ